MNATSEGSAASGVPASGAALDDAALSGSGGFRHGGALFGSEDELLQVAVPFLEEGMRAGDLTVVSGTPETTELLCRALGSAARAVESDTGLIPRTTRPPDVFTHLRQYAHRATQGGTSRLRVFAEVPGSDDPRQMREVMRLEAVANHVMAELPVTNLCAYDSRRLAPELVATARSTHPEWVSGPSWTANGAFRDPEGFVRGLPTPRDPADLPLVVAVVDAPTLPALRHGLTEALPRHVPDEEQLEDLRLGISEIAANAFRHGERPVSGRLWSDGRELVCEITDSGTAFDDPMAGFVPAHGFDLARGGMGLWLARKLFDHVDLLRRPTGLTVRLSAALR